MDTHYLDLNVGQETTLMMSILNQSIVHYHSNVCSFNVFERNLKKKAEVLIKETKNLIKKQ